MTIERASEAPRPVQELPDYLDDLTEIEERLVDAARRGGVLKAHEASEHDGDHEEPDAESEHIRAQLIRELLLGRHGDLDPAGVRLAGARIGDWLNLEGITTNSPLALRNCSISGAIHLSDARIRSLDLSGCEIVTLIADRMISDGNVCLGAGFRTTLPTPHGSIRLAAAQINGDLIMQGCSIENTSGPAINAERLNVSGTVFLDRQFTAVGAGPLGVVRLTAANIGGQLMLCSAQITSASEDVALHCDQLSVHGNFNLGEGAKISGQVRLLGASIGGQVSLRDAQLESTHNGAFAADSMIASSSVFIDGTFSAKTAGDQGAVRLTGARIDGQLKLRGAKLENLGGGPALEADSIHVRDSAFLDEGFTAVAATDRAAIQFAYCQVGRQLDLRGAHVENTHGPLLIDLEGTGTHTTFLSAGSICPSLSDTKACRTTHRLVDLNDFKYNQLPEASVNEWLHILGSHTFRYLPSPYQEFAALHRRAGHDGDQRRVLIAQQKDLHDRGQLGGRLARSVHLLWGLLGGYGYRSRRLAAALFGALIIAGGLGWGAGQWVTTANPVHYSAERSPSLTTTMHGEKCSTVELIGVGLDRGLPIGTTGVRERCDLDTRSAAGQVFTVAIWLVQAMIWALATLAVAGYTGLVRKSA